MKRLITSVVLLLLVTSYLLSCEKDDLCAEDTPTTPGLVIDFYTKGNTTLKKSIAKLYYNEAGSEKIDSITNSSRLILPLRSDAESVKFVLNTVSTLPGQQIPESDKVEFEIKYNSTQTYISRACGFKTTFNLIPRNPELNNPIVTDPSGENNPWFQQTDIQVITTNIEIEDDTNPHIKIYF